MEKHFSLSSLSYSLLLILIGFIPSVLQSQVQVDLTILEGQASTTCTDGLFGGQPGDVVWGIIVEDEPEITYAEENCPNFPDLPNLQFTTNLDCPSDLGDGTIRLCFRVFDKEAPLFDPCDDSNRACEEVVCDVFLIPAPGSEAIYTYSLPDGLSSAGTVTFSITTSENNAISSNDHLCHAVDLGTLEAGVILGDNNQGLYNNYCATALSEPSPHLESVSWQNNVGTWLSFTTSDNPNAIVLIEASSDPEEVGDPINLQLALYQATEGSCEGPLTLVKQQFDGSNFDEFLMADCLLPNQKYFILVDGEIATDESLRGIYGIQVQEMPVFNTFSDNICDAILLEVEENGTMNYEGFFNNCATNIDDPIISNFESNNSVWFEFRPTDSRSMNIIIESNQTYPFNIDPLDIEVALFFTPSNECTGTLVEVISQYNEVDGNTELLTLECLNPKQTYYLMVDGSQNDPIGIFDITITDMGYPTPIQIDSTICDGDLLTIGNNTYVNPGTYTDTIIIDDCLEIVEIDLQVSPPITIELNTERFASAEGAANGIQTVVPEGGMGDYTIEWSNGQMGTTAVGLIGGQEYCVRVSDAGGCQREACFIMEFIIPIEANITTTTVSCEGDSDGTISINVVEGQAPYDFTVQGIDHPEIIVSGQIMSNNSMLVVSDLAIGTYNIFINNQLTANNLIASIGTPAPLEISILNQVNARCFGNCNGELEIEVTGGDGIYAYSWSNNLPPVANIDNLCADSYRLTVTDGNNCSDSIQINITEPPEMEVAAQQLKPVTCFGQSNGQAILSSNVVLTSFFWDNGETAELATNLSAGIHEVTVTNENFCETVASVTISQPEAPLSAAIELIAPVTCSEDMDGILEDATIGGNANYQYSWSNGNTLNRIDGLAPGSYSLTVTDELGCQDFTTFTLDQPEFLTTVFSTKDVNCPEGETSGAIMIDNVVGGVEPYQFSLDGVLFTEEMAFNNLNAGAYEVIVKDANGCEKTYPQTVSSPPPITVTLGASQQIRLGEQISLEAITDRPLVNYEWTSSDSIGCINCSIITVQPTNNTFYSVKVTDEETGCIAEASVNVSVLRERGVYIPNAFSPNGDNINETWTIFGGSDVEQIIKCSIFSRDGALIHTANNFMPNTGVWDGVYKGQPMDEAVFIYFAEIQFIDGNSLLYKGDFSLIR